MSATTIETITSTAPPTQDKESKLDFPQIGNFFPLKPGTKKPAISAWQVTQPGSYQASESYGIALAETALVVDADPRNYPQGRDVLAELLNKFKGVLPSRVVRTPRGGVHIYLAKPADKRIKKSQADWPGIDFLSKGCYVVGPNTKLVECKDHPAGVYNLQNDADVRQAPAELLDALEAPAEALKAQSAVSISVDQGFPVSAVTPSQFDLVTVPAALKRIPADDYETWVKVGMALKSKGFSFGVWDEWSRTCPEKYDRAACEEKWSSFTSSGINLGSLFHMAKEYGFTFEPQYFPRTDTGNAARLAANFGHLLRWHKPSGNFLVWDGLRWKEDTTERPTAYAKETVEMIWKEAGSTGDELARKHAANSASAGKIAAMLNLAKPDLALETACLDQDPFLLNCKTGTINLKTGEIGLHRPENFITKLAPIEYVAGAAAPTFQKFLRDIFAGDESLIEYVQCLLGSCLTGSTVDQKMHVAYGQGQNGKSTLLNAVREILGDYAIETAQSLLTAPAKSGPTEDVYQLRGVRLATTVESEQGTQLNEARVKQITGGDTLNARPLYGKPTNFSPSHKLIMCTNHRPVIRSQGVAMWRRIRLIPFTVQIPDEKKDVHLPEKLKTEYSGILAWLVQGALKWLKNGLPQCDAVTVATEGYKASEDPLADFIDECCYLDQSATVRASDIRKEYVSWCRRNGIDELTKNAFPEQLEQRGLTRKVTNNGTIWLGVGLKSSPEYVDFQLRAIS